MGYPKLPVELKKKLQAKKRNKVRTYSGNFSSVRHKNLVSRFNRSLLDKYEIWLHKWGCPGRKRTVMLEKMKENNVTDVLLEMAQLRVSDMYEHQKLLAVF